MGLRPLTNEDVYLATLTGEDVGTLPYPRTNTEMYLKKLVDDGVPTPTEEVTGTDPEIEAEAGTRYVCGEVASLKITPPDDGLVDIIFTSGSTPTVLDLPDTVLLPEGFEVEADHVYELSILDGIYGAVMGWVV